MKFRSTPIRALAAAALLLLLTAAAAPGPQVPGARKAAGQALPPPQGSGRVEIPPQPSGLIEPIQSGEQQASIIIQALANTTRKSVVLMGTEDILAEKVRVPKALAAPRKEDLLAILAEAGFSVSEETFRGEDIILVGRDLRPPGRKGSLLRPGEKDTVQAGAGQSPETGPARAQAAGSVRIFRRDDGPEAAYLVIFETRSKADAETAKGILEGYFQGKAGKKAAAEGRKTSGPQTPGLPAER